jgi:hypothetical protein
MTFFQRAVATLIILVTAVAATSSVAYAGDGDGGSGGGSLGSSGGSVSVSVPGGGRSTTPSPPPDPPPSTTPPYYVEVTPCTECVANGNDEVCNAQRQPVEADVGMNWVPGDPLPKGDSVPQIVEHVSTTTGSVTDAGETVCIPPPPPPSPAEVWTALGASKTASEALPAPQIKVSPSTGLAQLETWFCLGNDTWNTYITVGPVEVDGYSVTLNAAPMEYYWYFGDSPQVSGFTTSSFTAGQCDGASDASATHTYVDMGTFSVGVVIAWVGAYTFAGPGGTGTEALGPVDQAESQQPYVVQEVRSVLVGGSG